MAGKKIGKVKKKGEGKAAPKRTAKRAPVAVGNKPGIFYARGGYRVE